MVKDVEKAEKMSIWRLCEIMDYLALENDMIEQEYNKQKRKIKK